MSQPHIIGVCGKYRVVRSIDNRDYSVKLTLEKETRDALDKPAWINVHTEWCSHPSRIVESDDAQTGVQTLLYLMHERIGGE